MDVRNALESQAATTWTVEMHTAGEPTRIIISGYPVLKGATLLEKRRYASERPEIDGIRKRFAIDPTRLLPTNKDTRVPTIQNHRLMLEPRGHAGMYGAILVPKTELTLSGEADIGVLFCHNEGYSTMCGHATIALGRFLVDTRDLEIFPHRESLRVETRDDQARTSVTVLRLHAPCGVVKVYVPTTPDGKSDATKPVRFHSVPSFASSPSSEHGHGLVVDIPPGSAWPKLLSRDSLRVNIDIAYGGAFYALVSTSELGFGTTGLRGSDTDFREIAEAARILRIVLNKDPKARESFVHPDEPDLGFLYGITIIDDRVAGAGTDGKKKQTWVCFFADEQIDRSPTGSCVSAHVPLAVDQGKLQMGEWCSYESFLSAQFPGNAFRGRAVQKTGKAYVVEIEGFAHYTGVSTFTCPQEDIDVIGEGFEVKLPIV
ncbi:hypothetical protein D9757_002452 [Collybiopsis confluens]|uniref:trans-L-3-hydroxyproline dehydratase n=1 Tax=Collybiopsis confluens TaxID=2823264 RepID=A0A8H5HXY9_9AGAR|nr:hypothetical protein D9757_002452 [Collybiopsis confluens]